MSEKYEFVDTTLTEPKCPFPVILMCRWLEVSTSGFYSWRARPDSATARRRDVLKKLITAEFTRSDETYGYRRLHAALARRGVAAGRELVRHLTRELGLLPCQPRPGRVGLTRADAAAGPIPDLVGRDFTADAPGHKLVAARHLHPDLGRVAVPGDGDRLLLQEGHRPRHGRPLPHVVDHHRDPRRRSDRTGRPSHLSHRPGGATTPPRSFTPLWSTSACAIRPGGPGSVTITRWPSPSSRP